MQIVWFYITCRKRRNLQRRGDKMMRNLPVRASYLAVLCFLWVNFVTAQTPQATPPPPASPHSGTFPKPVEQTLPNGLRVIVIERREYPLISAQLLIKNGGEVDLP